MEAEPIIAQLQERDFYLEKPRSTLWDLWLWILIFFPLCSSCGLAILALFGFGFLKLDTLEAVHAPGTWLAAFALAVGEIGGFFATIEVFRKYGRGEARRWDWVAVVVSGLTTVSAVTVGMAFLTDTTPWWHAFVIENTPLILSFLAVLDTVLAGSEAGMRLSFGSKAEEAWQKKYESWAKRQEQTIKRFQDLVWSIEEAKWQAEIEAWNNPNVVTVTTTKEQPIADSVGYCWCGRTYPAGTYDSHIADTHIPEVKHGRNGREVMAILRDLYPDAENLPSEEQWVNWLRRFVQRKE